ncbi:MAG: phosphotransferase [Chloroflexi bacterium]|nr:phosphotransferase [Chloroflexota bacterium]
MAEPLGLPISSVRALELARRHVPDAQRVTAVSERGWRHVAFEIDGEFVLKVRCPAAPKDEVTREATVLRYLEQTSNIPAPRLVAVGDEPRIGVYSCLTRMPGISLQHYGRPWPVGSVEATAGAAAQLHGLPVTPLREGQAVPLLDIELLWRMGIEDLAARGYVDAAGERALTRRYLRDEKLCGAERAVLLHRDLWPENCFVDADTGRFVGIIDFGDAALGPAAWEFGLAELPTAEWSGRLQAAYQAMVGPPADFDEQVEFCRFVNVVSTLPRVEGWARQQYWPMI